MAPLTTGGPPAGRAYAEYAPAIELRPFVECLWTRTSVHPIAGGRVHRIPPDGCTDIVVAFRDVSPHAPRSAAPPVSALVVGTMTRPMVVRTEPSLSMLGVRFRPGFARTFLGAATQDLTDERAPLRTLWSETDALLEELARSVTTTDRIRIVQRALAARVVRSPSPPPEVVSATRLIARSSGHVTVEALSRMLGVTRQHLARRFADWVGVSPKMLCRIVRTRAVTTRLRGAADVDWAAVAHDAGYYDQSHLVAEFKALVGLTPTAWLAWARAAEPVPFLQDGGRASA